MKKKRPIPEYDKRKLADELFKPRPQSNSQNLEDCIKEIFPDTKLIDLKTWSKTIRKESLEPEPLLFMALICGAHFQISRPEVTEYLSALWEWFTMRQMNPDLVDIVIEALAPGIRKAVEERGYMQGWPHGEYVRKKGHPMTARGTWVSAFVIENYLRQVGKKSTVAKALAVELVSILSGRKEEEIEVGEEIKPWEGVKLNEFYRIYKNAPKDTISNLTTELFETYKLWVKQDGVHEGDLEPPQDQVKKHSEWISRHKSLQYLIKQRGCEQFCDLMLGYIKSNLWKPLWDMKAGKLTKTRKANKLAKQ